MNKFDFNKLTPFKWFVLENFPFIEADFDALTEWQLFCKLGKEINKIIDSENTLGTQMENVTNAFIDLQNYVNNYFENLDVQDEINNKLNEMASDGTLQQLINVFIKSNCALIFDNVEDMKKSDIIVDGTFCKTLGFFARGDNGGSLYQIKEGDYTEDDSYVIKIKDNLYAILIYDSVLNLKQLGISTSNSATKNSTLLYNAFKKFSTGGTLIIPNELIPINNIVFDFSISGITLKGLDSESSGFTCNVNNAFTFDFTLPVKNTTFKDFRIDCFDSASGIAFEDNDVENHGNISINNVYIRNAHKGFKLHKVVYLFANRANVGLTQNATSDDYAYELQGYEYNRFENCASQINGDLSTYPAVDIFRLLSTSFTWIKNCEFVKTGGNSVHVLSDAEDCNHIYIETCEFYRVRTGVLLETANKNISNVNITNTHVTILGEGIENECAIRTIKTETNKINSLNVVNLNVYRFNSISAPLMIFEPSTINTMSLINISNSYNNQPIINFNDNKPSKLSFTNPNTDQSITIQGDGSKTEFNIIFNSGTEPVITNKIPQILVQPIDDPLKNTYYHVSPSYYDNQNRLRCQIKFETPPANGQYQLQCHVIF